MIDSVGVNHRVGVIWIGLRRNNPIDSGLIGRMNRQWRNVYYIWIGDESDSVDGERHRALKEMVEEKTLLEFTLSFSNSPLYVSEDGLRLMKEYNSILKKKEHLERLEY